MFFFSLVVSACENRNEINQISLTDQDKTVTADKLNSDLGSVTQKAAAVKDNLKEFKDGKLGISFKYPAELKIKREKNGIRVFHELDFEHSDPCDNSDNIKTLKKFADFDITISVANEKKTIGEGCQNNSRPSLNADLGESQDCFLINGLKGEIITSIYQGCGNLTYNFPLDNGKTLIVKRNLVPLLGVGAIPEEKEKAEKLPQLITTADNNRIFFQIISSLKVNQ